MQYSYIENGGLKVSSFALGCSRIGSLLTGASTKEDRRLIFEAIDNGVTLFDTANIYGQGRSESLLGGLLGSNLHEAIVATKAGQCFSRFHKFGSYFRTPISFISSTSPRFKSMIRRARQQPLATCFKTEYLQHEIEQSLNRLKIDRIAIFYLHNPVLEDLTDGATVHLMEKLKREGKIGIWGVSCDDDDETDKILRAVNPDALQVNIAFLRDANDDRNSLLRSIAERGCAIFVRGIPFKYISESNSRVIQNELANYMKLVNKYSIKSVISGTSNINHLKNNLDTFMTFCEMNDEAVGQKAN